MTISFTLLFPCLVALAEPEAPAKSEPEVTVEFLRDVLRSQLESVRSFSATYTISQKALARPARDWGPKHHVLRIDGSRISVRTQRGDTDDPPYVYSFDGQFGFDVTERINAPPQIEIFAARPRNIDSVTKPLDSIGARVWLAELPLATLMEHPSCTLSGLVDLDGTSCWSVTMSGMDKRADSPILVEAWFDPTHDYLPRKISVLREGWPRETFHMIWTVLTFKATSAETGLRWIPLLAEFHQTMSVQQLSVSSFELNPELPDSAFTPDTRLGAQVFDIRNPANVRSYATGDGKAVQQRARELAQSAKEQVTRNPVLTSELSATPAQPRVWIRALLWGSLACLTAACLLRRRLRWLSSLLHRNRM